MSHPVQLRAPSDEVVGPPAECFTSPEWHERDLEAIFRPAWHLVAHRSELAEPGAFVTFALGREEIVVVRGRDGEVHAFHNFCRHRGHPLCTEPRGTLRKNLVCGYHGWSYSPVDGSCQTAVRMHEDFDRSAWGLLPAHVEEVDGLVFACFADERPRSMADVFQSVDRGGYDISRMKLATRVSWDIAANWKIVLENQSECYHCSINHPTLNSNYHPWENDYVEDLDAAGADSIAEIGSGEFGARDHKPGITYTVGGKRVCTIRAPRTDDATELLCHEVWWKPLGNVMMNAPDYTFIGTVRPLGPERAQQDWFVLVHEDAREGVDYELDDLTEMGRVTLDEDKVLCERVQRSLTMPRYVPGPMNRHYQAGGITLYRWYEAMMADRGIALPSQ